MRSKRELVTSADVPRILCALCGGYELHKLAGITEPLFHFWGQRLCRNMRGCGHISVRGISGDELDCVDANVAFVIRKRVLDQRCEILRFRATHRNNPHQLLEFLGSHITGKLNARHSSSIQQLSKTAL